MKQRLVRVVQIPAYWLIVGLATVIVSPILSTFVSVQVNKRTIAESEEIKRTAQVEGRQRACRLIGAQIEVFREAKSVVGEKALEAWLVEYRLSGCQPPK